VEAGLPGAERESGPLYPRSSSPGFTRAWIGVGGALASKAEESLAKGKREIEQRL